MLKTRVITAVILFIVVIAALFFFNAQVWAVFSAGMVGLALWEFTRMAKLSQLTQAAYLFISALCAAGLYHFNFTQSKGIFILSLVFWLILAPCWLYKKWKLQSPLVSMALGWVLMFPAWLALMAWRPSPDQAQGLLALMGLVWVADIAAYFSGRAFGKRKLAPSISPGKSWAGVYGALICVAIYTICVAQMGWLPTTQNSLIVTVVLALALTAVSVEGDLLESWFKRASGIKDSSQLLPGHGGVYDRIDSLIAVLAVSHALYSLGLF